MRRFVILMAAGRVGSNLIADGLAARDCVLISNEFTTRIRSLGRKAGTDEAAISERQKQAFLDLYEHAKDLRPWYRRLSPRRAKVRFVGSKLALSSFVDEDWFANKIREMNIRTVCMERANFVKSAVSVIRAQALAENTRKKYGKASWALKRASDRVPAFDIAPDDVLQQAERQCQLAQRLNAFIDRLGETQTMRIEYATMCKDLAQTTAAVGEFIGLDTPLPPAKHLKATSDDLSHAISNFHAVHARLRGTPYEEMLLEGTNLQV